MIITLVTFLLISNALSLRKDKSTLYSRIVMIGLILTSILAFNNFFSIGLYKGIGLYSGLFHVTAFTQSLNIFIFISSIIGLTLYLFKNKLQMVPVYFFVYGNSSIIVIRVFIYVIYLIFILCSFDFMSLFIDHYCMEHDLDIGILNCEGSSGNGPTDNPEPHDNNGGGKGKKPKPNLHIKVDAETDSEKATKKIANCYHDKMTVFEANTLQDAEETMCNFSDTFDSQGKDESHKAFNSGNDVAFVCNNCHAIRCKNCGVDYSSSENSSPNK